MFHYFGEDFASSHILSVHCVCKQVDSFIMALVEAVIV